MKITVLDSYGLHDMDWSGIAAFGDLSMHEGTRPEEVAARAAGSEIVLTNKTPLGRDTLRALLALRMIGVLATGYNIVDAAAARELGIDVCNVPAYSTDSVAQLVFAHILEHCHNIGRHSDAVQSGRWAENGHFVFWDSPLTELCGKTLGVVGMGRIGRRVAVLGDAFGMRILGYSRSRAEPPAVRDFAWAELHELFAASDFITLHCPLTDETKGLVNADLLSLVKPTAFLVNTARGPVVNERDLADALNAGKIAGAGLDVVSTEPVTAGNPLLSAKNCRITPHIAWATTEARLRLIEITAQNIAAYLEGRPIHIVNP